MCMHQKFHKQLTEFHQDDIHWVTRHWILIVTPQHYISFACHARRMGILLYRKNGDLLTSLTLSLHKGTCVKSTSGEHKSPSHDTAKVYDRKNSCIHDEIHKYLSANLKNTFI